VHWPHRGQTSFFAVLACESTKNSPLPCYNLAPREDHDDGKMGWATVHHRADRPVTARTGSFIIALRADSSLGNAPRVLIILRNERCNASTLLVV